MNYPLGIRYAHKTDLVGSEPGSALLNSLRTAHDKAVCNLHIGMAKRYQRVSYVIDPHCCEFKKLHGGTDSK